MWSRIIIIAPTKLDLLFEYLRENKRNKKGLKLEPDSCFSSNDRRCLCYTQQTFEIILSTPVAYS